MSWLEAETVALNFARGAAGLAVNWLIQSTLLIVGGIVVGRLLRHRGSAVQSAVYRTTLVAVVVCPLATWGLSLLGVTGWSLQMPAAYTAAAIPVPAESRVTVDVPLVDIKPTPMATVEDHRTGPVIQSPADT